MKKGLEIWRVTCMDEPLRKIMNSTFKTFARGSKKEPLKRQAAAAALQP
jgi:hypothetical protein